MSQINLDLKLEHISQKLIILKEAQSNLINQKNSIKNEFVNLKSCFTSNYSIIINDLTLIINAVSTQTASQEQEKIVEDTEESPASVKRLFYNDEIFNITRTANTAWTLFSLSEPMILDHIYKLKATKFINMV